MFTARCSRSSISLRATLAQAAARGPKDSKVSPTRNENTDGRWSGRNMNALDVTSTVLRNPTTIVSADTVNTL